LCGLKVCWLRVGGLTVGVEDQGILQSAHIGVAVKEIRKWGLKSFAGLLRSCRVLVLEGAAAS
jgi:hypothetical protein